MNSENIGKFAAFDSGLPVRSLVILYRRQLITFVGINCSGF
jgi:hypothetical protein